MNKFVVICDDNCINQHSVSSGIMEKIEGFSLMGQKGTYGHIMPQMHQIKIKGIKSP